MTHPPDFTGLSPTDPGAHRIQLGVDAQGRVWFALPLRESENLPMSSQLVERLAQARFEPLEHQQQKKKEKDAQAPTWGVATFAWESDQ